MNCSNNTQKPFFSIVVPVYNVEKYIERCIGSIIKQDFDDYEVILIDDGSTDNSPMICDDIGKKDSRFSVIHKRNGGLSTARNVGLRKACGEYIVYIDSDDELMPDSLGKIREHIKNMENCEILQVKATVFEEQRQKMQGISAIPIVEHVINGKAYMKCAINNHSFIVSVWAYIFKRTFLIDNELYFMEGVYHEDEEYLPRAMLCSNAVANFDCVHYLYRIRENSTTTKKDQSKNAADLLMISKSLQALYEALDDVELKAMLYDRLVSMQLYAVILGKLYHRSNNDVDSCFLRENALAVSNKIKAIVFSLNKGLYYVLECAFLRIKRLLIGIKL